MRSIEIKIKNLLEERFQEADFQDCFLVDMIHSNTKLQVFLDSDTGIGFKTCRLISRYLEQYLDESGELGDKYTLEVSSPGADKPLKLYRQYPKHVGRKIKIILKGEERETVEGKLLSVNPNELEIEVQKTKKEKEISVINFEKIDESKIIISI